MTGDLEFFYRTELNGESTKLFSTLALQPGPNSLTNRFEQDRGRTALTFRLSPELTSLRRYRPSILRDFYREVRDFFTHLTQLVLGGKCALRNCFGGRNRNQRYEDHCLRKRGSQTFFHRVLEKSSSDTVLRGQFIWVERP